MNKNALIVIGIISTLVIGFLVFRFVGGLSVEEDIEPTPTPSPAYRQVDDSVEAELSLQLNGKFVDLTITGLDGKYEIVEYELSYKTDKGPKGSIGKVTLSSGQDVVEREVRLGTCSAGGACTDHAGVSNFKVALKFHTKDGEVFILRKEFDEL